jgi:putative transposase
MPMEDAAKRVWFWFYYMS